MDILQYLQFLRKKKIALYLILSLVGVFLILTVIVFFIPPSIIDLEFSEELQEYNHPLLDILMKGISWFGSSWVAVIIVVGAALIFFVSNYKIEAVFILLTFVNTLVNYGLKLLINRPRPTDDLVRVIIKSQHQSFPSGHTSFYVIFFGFLIFLMIKITAVSNFIRYSIILFSLFLIFSVPFSRIYLGAHWFTDVTGGFVLGLMLLYVLILIYLQKCEQKKITQ